MYTSILKTYISGDLPYIVKTGKVLKDANGIDVKEHILLKKKDGTPLASVFSKKYEGLLTDGTKHIIWRRDHSNDGGLKTLLEKQVDIQNEKNYPMHPDITTYSLGAIKKKNNNFSNILKSGTVAGAEKRWEGHVPNGNESNGRLTKPNDIQLAKDVIGSNALAKEGERTYLPLTSKAPLEVQEHLNSSGFDTSDLHNGVVKDSHGRITNAGKALIKSKAPKELVDDYAKNRQGSNLALQDHQIVTSTKPLDIAGMTSNTDWADDSCMNLANGANRKYLEKDIENGTKVHFLTHKDDTNIERPIARALSKPYIGKLPDGTSHIIYRRDSKVYGSSNSAFGDSIDAHNEKEYPLHPDVATYELHPDLYQNQQLGTVYNTDNMLHNNLDLSSDYITAAASNKNKDIALAAINHQKASHDTIKAALLHPNPVVALAALNHSLGSYHKDYALYNNAHKDVALSILKDPNISTETLGHAARHSNKEVALAALNHPNANIEVLQEAARNQNKEVALAALNDSKANDSVIKSSVNNPNKSIALAAINHPSADNYLLEDAVAHPNKEVALAALNHQHVDTDVLKVAARHSNKDVALAALGHPLVNSKVVGVASKNINSAVVLEALKHPKVRSDTINNAAQSSNPEIANTAKNHPLYTP